MVPELRLLLMFGLFSLGQLLAEALPLLLVTGRLILPLVLFGSLTVLRPPVATEDEVEVFSFLAEDELRLSA